MPRTSVASAKRRAADLRLQKNFGITLNEYETVLEHQGRRCAICRRPAACCKNRLAVDHDHRTGALRGLLCFRCNKLLLGSFMDSLTLLQGAVAYLTHPPLSEAIGERVTAPGRVGTKKRAKLLKQFKGAR